MLHIFVQMFYNLSNLNKKVFFKDINDITSDVVEIYEQSPVVQWKPLNRTTEGHRQTDLNN
jgi:hypothetical protein